MRSVAAVAFSVVVLGAVLSPLHRHPDDDDYPLSTYPMFSHGRDTPETHVTHVVAIDAQGTRTNVPPRVVISGEVLQAQVAIRSAVEAGPHATRRFCNEVAARVGVADDPQLRASTHVEVETTLIDAIAYLGGDETPIARTVHARCRRTP